MVNPIGRLEGMAKGLFNATVQTVDLFVDIADEVLTGADKYEGNGVLDTLWGSWQDNVLGEGGVVQSLFGPDEFDENGNPNAAFGGHFFGSIPESVRHPATKILNPAMEALDLTYEYAVDRPIGTMVTYANMVANDGIFTIVDPKSWEEAWTATGSRSWGQAFALLSRGIDLDDPDAVERFEGTSYYNLLSGSVDLFSNWFLDPANLAALGFAKIIKKARRAKNAKLIASGEFVNTRSYIKFKERLIGIKDAAIHADDPALHLQFSARYQKGQGYEQSDLANIGVLSVRITEAAGKGRLGNMFKGELTDELAFAFAVQLGGAKVGKQGDAIDTLIQLLTDSGEGSVYQTLRDKAQLYVRDLYEKGGLKPELEMLTKDVSDYLRYGPDGNPLSLDEYIQILEDGLTDRYGTALHPTRAQTLENMKFLRGMIDMEGGYLTDLFDGVVLGKRITKPSQVTEAQTKIVEQARTAAKDLGLRFNPADAAIVDPIGEGFFRWFRPTSTDRAYLRNKLFEELTEQDQNNLLHWAGIPVGDAVKKREFITNWDELIGTDRILDDIIITARTKHRNKAGAYRPGDPEIGQRLREAGLHRMLDAMDELLLEDPVQLPGQGLEKHLLKKKGLRSTKRVRRGRRPHANDARVKAKPDYNATVTEAGNIQNNALKQLWDDLNKEWTEAQLREPDWDPSDPTAMTAEGPYDRDLNKFIRLPEEQRHQILKQQLPKELHQYIGKTIDQIIDRVPGGKDLKTGKPTAAGLAVVDELYDAIGRLEIETKSVPKLDPETGREIYETTRRQDPETGEWSDVEELVYENVPKDTAAQTQAAIPNRGDYIKRWAPPRRYRETVDWYDDVNYRPTTTQLTPEDGLDPHWQKFINDVEADRLNSSFEWNDRWKSIVRGRPALAEGLKFRRTFDELSEEAQLEFIDSVSPYDRNLNKFIRLMEHPDYLSPREIKKLEEQIAELRKSRLRGGAARKDQIKELQGELNRANTLLDGGRVGAKAFSELRTKGGVLGSLRTEYRKWIDEATPEQLRELKEKITGQTDIKEAEKAWAKLSSQEQVKAFNNLVRKGGELQTTFPKIDSLRERIIEYDEFVKYSGHWDEVLESKFGEIPEDFSELRSAEVGDIKASADTIRELLAERHEIRRQPAGQYEYPVLDELGNQKLDAAGNPMWEASPYAPEGIGGLEAQKYERAAYKFGLRRPLLTTGEIPVIARMSSRGGAMTEVTPEHRMWYSKPGKDDVKVKIDPDEKTTVWDKNRGKWVRLNEHPAFAENLERVKKTWIPPKKMPDPKTGKDEYITLETPGYFTKREREGYWEYEDNPAALTEGWTYENAWFSPDGTPIDDWRLGQLERVENVVHGVRDPRVMGPTGRIFEALGDEDLLRRQREIENKLMEEYPELPFAAALVFEDHRLKNVARRKDARDMQHENINALYDALNGGQNKDIIEVVADQIISRHIPNIGAFEAVPGVSRFDEIRGAVRGGMGSAARTFSDQGYVREFVYNFEQKTGIPVQMPNLRVRYFVEKVTQGLIHWDDPIQGFEQFKRMLRDANRVRPKFYQKSADVADQNLMEYAGLNTEELLGRWVQNPDRQARMLLFEETVDTLNTSLGKMFEGRIGEWKDGKFVNTSSQQLTRILRRNWRSAQREVNDMGARARLYGTSQTGSVNSTRLFMLDENRVINVRQVPYTPQQLVEATLVPRYDLYANAFSDQSKVMKAAQGIRDGVGIGLDTFTTLWKKSVLLRPAWPVRVLTDEFMRVSADYGTMTALKGVAGGLGELRAGLFQRQGIDLGGPLQAKMREVLDEANIKIELPGSGLRPFDPKFANADELLQTINKHFDGDPKKLQDLMKEVIYEEYGKQRIRRRVMGATAIGAWMAGPAGLAGAALYGLYSRGSLQRLAKLETLNHMGFSLSQIGRHQVDEQILLIEKQLSRLDPVKNSEEVTRLIKQAEDLEEGRKILLTQARQLQDQFTLRDRVTGRMRKQLEERKNEIADTSENIAAYREGTLVQNFDTAGKIMVDAGVSDFHLDGYTIGNAFGNTPQAIQLHRNSISANQYRGALWNGTSAVTRKTLRQATRREYNISEAGPKVFADAYDDTVNHQWIPMQDPNAYSRPGSFRPRAETDDMVAARSSFTNAETAFQDNLQKLQDKYGEGYLLDLETAPLTPEELEEFTVLNQARMEAANNFEEAGTYWAGERGPVAISATGTIDIGKSQNAEAVADAKWWRENGGVPFTAGQNPFQDFSMLFWMDNVTDDDILEWLAFGDGRTLKDAMPAHFTDNLHSLEDWVRLVRYETNGIIPDIPEFSHLRKKAARGEEIRWARDIQPILDTRFGGQVDGVRALGYENFGVIIGDSALDDAHKTAGMIVRLKRWTDEAFTHLGTMPTDLLTRSTVFRSVYSGEVARRLPNFKTDDGAYRLTQKELNAIEGEARRIGIRKTKDLLYDLAERTKFEELVSNIMPFFAAYQEVLTRWAGLSARNPGFVLATTRNFHNGLENFNAVDEETGAPLFLLRFGTILGTETPSWLPLIGDTKVFGRFAQLGQNPIKLNLASMSMLSGGLPGFGPIVAFAASEAAVRVPSVSESLDWAFPYGLAEGGNILERFVDSSTPLWTQTARSAMFSTYERQRVRARVASDMIVEYELNGEAIETPADMAAFEDEVDDRVSAMMRLRMSANLLSPISFMYQSPHAHVISHYRKIMKAEGVEAADEWLLVENPDFWGVVGRQTRVKDGAVASASLFGEEMYEKFPEFYTDNVVIQDLLVGKVGPIDVQMASEVAFNQTVFRKEIGEGRRVYQTPAEIAKRAAGNAGWFWYERGMQPIRQKQEQLRLSGLPSSLNAKANIGLKQARQMVIASVSRKYPLWREQFDNIKTAEENAKVLHSLRNWVNNPEISGWHPSVTHVIAYLQKRDEITGILLQRSQQSGDSQMQLLSHPANVDKKEEWESARIAFANVPDMSPVFVRYLDQDDVITRASWPKNQKAYQLLVGAAA